MGKEVFLQYASLWLPATAQTVMPKYSAGTWVHSSIPYSLLLFILSRSAVPTSSHCCCQCWVAKSCVTLLKPRGLWPTRLLCPWDAPGKDTGVGCHYSLSSWKVIFTLPHPLSDSGQFDSHWVPAVRSFFCGWVRVLHISHPLAGFLFPALHSSMLAFTLHLNVLPIMQIWSSQPHSLKHFSTSLTAPFLSPKGKVCAPSNGPKDPASSGP